MIGLAAMTLVSHRGNCFMIHNYSVSWFSKKQPKVASLSYEAKYRAAFNVIVECVWLRRLLSDLSLQQPSPTSIFKDSQSALAIARNPVFHARTEHIEVHYHYGAVPC